MTEITEITAKYGGIEKLPDTAQGPNYRVSCYPSHGRGFSNFASLKMFINGCEEQSPAAIVRLLEGVSVKTVMTLQVRQGNVRQTKEDDGEFGSYYWNIVRLLTVGGAAVKVEAHAAKGDTPPAEGDTPADQGGTPPNTDTPPTESDSPQDDGGNQEPLFPPEPGAPEPVAETPPGPEVGETPTREQAQAIKKVQDKVASSILASWSVNQARETYQYLFPAPAEDKMDEMFNDIHRLALRYIRMKQHLDGLIQGGTK